MGMFDGDVVKICTEKAEELYKVFLERSELEFSKTSPKTEDEARYLIDAQMNGMDMGKRIKKLHHMLKERGLESPRISAIYMELMTHGITMTHKAAERAGMPPGTLEKFKDESMEELIKTLMELRRKQGK